MSQCPHCFVGQCQRHKLQDHGKREMMLKAKMADPKATQRRLYDAIVTKQLDRLEAAARITSEAENVSRISVQNIQILLVLYRVLFVGVVHSRGH